MLCVLLVSLSGAATSEIFYEDFETQTVESSVAGGNEHFSWAGETRVRVSDEKSYSGDKSLRFTFPGNTDPSAMTTAEQRFSLNTPLSEVWIRYKLWIPENYHHRNSSGADNNKGLIMLWGDGYNTGPTISTHFELPKDMTNGISDSNPGGSIVYASWRREDGSLRNFYNPDNLSENHAGNVGPLRGISASHFGKWNDIVIHAKVSDNNTNFNGAIQLWINGELLYSVTDATNFFAENNHWDMGYILGWTNSGFDEDTVFYLDEFTLGHTPGDIDFSVNRPLFRSVIKVIN